MKKKKISTTDNNYLENLENFSIRNEYASIGVTEFYELYGSEYENPHFKQIESLILSNFEKFDWQNTLDLSCGSGEVSKILRKKNIKTIATDPYTMAAFERNFDSKCLPYSFDDIIKGSLDQYHFTTIICSFAMHLCPEAKLYPLVSKLLKNNTYLGIITPHKRPDLRKVDGVENVWNDFALTERGKKVYLNVYKSKYSLE